MASRTIPVSDTESGSPEQLEYKSAKAMGNRDTRISVIVVNYNGMPHLDACISSILKQAYSNYEVIVVDNNSSDGSLEYARSKFPQVVFVANDVNVGYGGGIKAGLPYATGGYIAPLNMDTEVGPNWLGIMATFLDRNQRAGAVTPKILLFDQRDKINALGANIHITGLSFCRGLGKTDDRSPDPEGVPGFSGCSYLIRREILEEIVDVVQTCFMGNDDVICSWMVNLLGYEIYCVPEAVVYHKYKLGMNPDKFFYLEKNRQALLLSSLQPLTLVVMFPLLALIELLMVGYCFMKGKRYFKSKLRAFTSLYTYRERIRQHRTQVQKLRRISDFQLFKRLRWNLDWHQLAIISIVRRRFETSERAAKPADDGFEQHPLMGPKDIRL